MKGKEIGCFVNYCIYMATALNSNWKVDLFFNCKRKEKRQILHFHKSFSLKQSAVLRS